MRRPMIRLWLLLLASLPAAAVSADPVWQPLSPPFVQGHRLVYLPSQNAVLQIGGVEPIDAYVPGYSFNLSSSPGDMWMWPLDGRTAFRLGTPPPEFLPSQVGAVFYEPQGDRVVHLRTTMRVHNASALGPFWGTIPATGTPPPEAGLVGYER
ncbi:MAG: hypothetical protein ABIP29_03300, partial [Candidatus Eisenbacteria bacterium]